MLVLLLHGKTGLSIELAKRINGEIISADSMQIYKGLDIGTAKVTKEEMQGISHHLIDICNIDEKFSVADFKEMCYDKIDEIFSREHNPIIVGGTGLYFSAVVNDMQFGKQDFDLEYRENLYNLAESNSNEYVHNMLKKIDPKSASQIHPNNLKRVIRALEIAKMSNELKSKHMENEQKRISNMDNKYSFLLYAFDYDRDVLYDRINKRVDIMIDMGLVDEARMVYDLNLGSDNTCMQAIGYKEFFPYFEQKATLQECVDKLKQETRKYAKRQLTWFRNKLDVKYLAPSENIDCLINDIIKDINTL